VIKLLSRFFLVSMAQTPCRPTHARHASLVDSGRHAKTINADTTTTDSATWK
jgi:hypothetical protein